MDLHIINEVVLGGHIFKAYHHSWSKITLSKGFLQGGDSLHIKIKRSRNNRVFAWFLGGTAKNYDWDAYYGSFSLF